MAAPPAPPHSSSARLLLLAEETADIETIRRAGLGIPLGVLQTEDGRVSFRPHLQVLPAGSTNLSLSLLCCSSKGPSMVHCKMSGRGYSRPEQHDKFHFVCKPCTPDESHVMLHSGRNAHHNVVSIQVDTCEKITVLFMVYDLGLGSPPGAGLHLNRARLQGSLCDVKLVVEGVELPAHRAVLAVRSPVLERMLTGDFKEAREGRVELVGSSRTVVEKFLDFLYTDQIEDWANCELELLQLADQYMVPELRAECARRLWSCDPPRALKLLQCTAAGATEKISCALRRRLTTIVVDNMQVLQETSEWAEFKAAHPVLVDIMFGTATALTRSSTTSVCDFKL